MAVPTLTGSAPRRAARSSLARSAPAASATTGPPDGAHRSSHRALVDPVSVPPRLSPAHRFRGRDPRLDAVLVITCRGHEHPRNGLTTAQRISQAYGCPLVVLAAGPAGDLDAGRGLPAQATVVRVDGHGEHLPDLDTDRLLTRLQRSAVPGVEDHPSVLPIAPTRNLGLALAVAAGWHRVLLLDDDVQPFRPGRGPGVRGTLDQRGLDAALRVIAGGRADAVGWSLERFSDNSVVCRARRELGLPQDCFIGGGALLLRVHPGIPFFPATYNEDWLLLLALMATRSVRIGGSVRQDGYSDAAFRPDRAAREEVGDLLAEGLFALMHQAPPWAEGHELARAGGKPFRHWATSPAHWGRVIAARRQMLCELRDEAARRDPFGTGPAARLGPALDAALHVHDHAFAAGRPRSDAVNRLAGYLDSYRRDQSRWEAFLRRDNRDWLIRKLDVPEHLL